MTQSFFTTNNSGVGNESSVLCEFYIQVSDGQAHQIAIDKEAEKSVYQFVVDIGVDECKFTLPDNQPFKWLPYNAGISMANPDSFEGGLGRVGSGLYFFAVAGVITVFGALLTNRRDA